MYRPGSHILTLVAPAAELPVSTRDMKAHLRVTGSEEDYLIESYTRAAVAALDGMGELGRAIVSQSWAESFQTASRDVNLAMTPAQSITSVKYYDDSNTLQTANLSDFTLYKGDDWAFVRSDNWPTGYDRPDAITVEYVAGYGPAGSVPVDICHAIKLIVAHWYENREDASAANLNNIPRGATMLINLHRTGWAGA